MSRPKSPFAAAPWLALALTLLAPAARAAESKDSASHAGRNYDLRVSASPAAAPAPTPAQAAAIARWRDRAPDLVLDRDPRTGAMRSFARLGGYLSADGGGGDVETLALAFVRAELDLLGLTAEDLDDYEVTNLVPSRATGLFHLYLRQRHAGIPVYNGQLQVNLLGDGRVLSVHNQFLPDLARAVNRTEPAIPVAEAVAAVAAHLGEPAAGMIDHAAGARLMFLPIRAGEARLVWNFQVETADREHWYDVTVDAEDARVWTRLDWVAADQYKVYPIPVESPNHTTPLPPGDGRATPVNPATANGSPFGWHDTNGAAGAEFTTTQGNNVHAYTDVDANNLPDAGSSPDGGPTLDFTFPLDLTQPPSAYRPAAVTNLFYWNNVQHDVLYQYGFDEAAGNFQQNNYGLGGLGNDYVQAEAQDGSGTNNANFATPADGSKPRMQMYIWTAPTPDKDGDLDAGIILHEYGHGVSNRLTGGPAQVGCLGNAEQMGEGWSDWMTVVFTALAGHTATTNRGVGTYALDQPVNGPGIRPAPYNTDFAVNNYTYSNLPAMAIPHGVGFVWNTMLWEMYWELVDAHGFNPDLYDPWSTGGNNLAMQLVIDGMKLQPCSPGFVDGRNAILAADTALTSGANQCRIWAAFARRGLGFSASQGSSSSAADGTAAFDIPVACDYLGAAVTSQEICAGSPAVYNIDLGAAFTPPVTMAVTGNPAPSTAGFVPNPVVAVPGATTLTIGNTAGVGAGSYPLSVTGNGDGAHALALTLDVVVDIAAAPSLMSPVDSTSGHPVLPEFQWSASAAAADYTLEVDDDPSFTSLDYSAVVAGTAHTPTNSLPSGVVVYWRVRANNACGTSANSAVHHFATSSGQFCSAGGLTVPASGTSGVASPYPSTLGVSGAPTGPGSIKLLINGYTHTYPDDNDFLLVAPGGQKMIVMSDVGGSTGIVAIDLSLDDAAPTLLPDSGQLATGSYRPSNVGAGDAFAAPAPGGPYGEPAPAGAATLASVFGAGDPNGTWNLYVVDDAGGDSGTIAGWCLELPVSMPFIDGFETTDTSRWSLTQP